MGSRPNLFEYLSVPVREDVLTSGTRLTETDGESYDEDAALVYSLLAGDGTAMTATIETYDDHPGVSGTASPAGMIFDTIETRTAPETYDDDPGLNGLTLSSSLVGETSLTKVENETYDDVVGLDVLGIPQH